MWIITKNGVARNVDDIGVLSVVKKDDGNFDVVPFLKVEDRALATFDNAADAQIYIENLVDELNGNKPKLGYAFTWLAKVKQLPPDKQAEFNDMVEDWLDDLNKIPADVKPKKFNDDGVEW